MGTPDSCQSTVRRLGVATKDFQSALEGEQELFTLWKKAESALAGTFPEDGEVTHPGTGSRYRVRGTSGNTSIENVWPGAFQWEHEDDYEDE